MRISVVSDERRTRGDARLGGGRFAGGAARVRRLSRRAGLVGLVLWAGCAKDTRMSVEQFLAMPQTTGGVSTVQPGIPTTQPAGPAIEPWAVGPYQVGAGDVLTLIIPALADVGAKDTILVRVTEEESISLPVIGKISVAGLTLDQVEKEIRTQAKNEFRGDEIQVTAEITSYRQQSVLVMGDVANQSMVELRRDRMSVMQAVLAAGGPTAFEGAVTLFPARSPAEPVRFDLTNRADFAKTVKVGLLQPNDVLIVDRRPQDSVFVLGLVNTPGPIALPRGAQLSILQAIAAAGGTLQQFRPAEATLTRRGPDGKPIRVKIDLARTERGEAVDLALAAGDLLVIPHTDQTRFEEFLAHNLIFRGGLDTTFNPWTFYYFKEDSKTRQLGGGADGGFFSTFGRNIINQDLTPLITPAVPTPGRP